ncbi:MAG: glycoside hydrolase, partial [Bacteroides sp.]
MKRNITLFLMIALACLPYLQAQVKHNTVIEPLNNERWWGGLVALGHQMPYSDKLSMQDMARNNLNNQVVPLMLSSEGRYIWSEHPFRFEVKDGRL